MSFAFFFFRVEENLYIEKKKNKGGGEKIVTWVQMTKMKASLPLSIVLEVLNMSLQVLEKSPVHDTNLQTK